MGSVNALTMIFTSLGYLPLGRKLKTRIGIDIHIELKVGYSNLIPHHIATMGGAFQTKLVGQSGSLSGCSAILRYKNKNLNAEMSIYKCDSFAWLR